MSRYTGYKYSAADEAWKKANTTRMTFRFNNRTDADILEQLSEQDSKLGYVKRLIREDIKKENQSSYSE